MTNRCLLIDTASLYFRAFYGLPNSMRAADGRQVNAVRGLLGSLARLIEDYQPSHLVCCWDDDWRPNWRVELLPSYKTHRLNAHGGEETPIEIDHQVWWIRQVLAAVGLAVIGAQDYEADDVIGTLAASATMPTDIVTGDRDLFQLVDDAAGVRVIYVAKGISKAVVVTDDWVRDRYGVSPAQYGELAALRGDPSDGIPGVYGIGEKTAAKLLSEWGSLRAIRAAAAAGKLTPRLSEKFSDATGYLDIALDVVRVVRNLPVCIADSCRVPSAPVDPQSFENLRIELKLGSSADRLLAALDR